MATRSVNILINATDKASGKFNKAGGAAATFGKAIKKLATVGVSALAALTAAVVEATREFVEFNLMIHKAAIQTGVSAESLSELRFAARVLGIDFDDLKGSIEEFNIRLGETARTGKGPLADAFTELKLDAQEIIDLPMDEAIARVADEINKFGAEDRGHLADEIFGGDAFKIMPLLRQGAEGIGELSDEAQRLGVTVDRQSVRSATMLGRAFTRMQETGRATFREIGESVSFFATVAIGAVTTFAKNAGTIFRGFGALMALQIVRPLEEFIHFLTVRIPDLVKWFVENVVNAFRNMGEAVRIIFVNLSENIGELIERLNDFIMSGFEGGLNQLMLDVGEIAGQNLLKGFEAKFDELPEVVERQKSPLEAALEAVVDAANAKIGRDFFHLSGFGQRPSPQDQAPTRFLSGDGNILSTIANSAKLLGEFPSMLDTVLEQAFERPKPLDMFAIMTNASGALGDLFGFLDPDFKRGGPTDVENFAQQGRLLSGRGFLSQDPQKQVAANTKEMKVTMKDVRDLTEDVVGFLGDLVNSDSGIKGKK